LSDPLIVPSTNHPRPSESCPEQPGYGFFNSLLVSLIQHGVLEFHVWGCRIDAPDCPDMLVFDLDPDERLEWRAVVDAALETRDLLNDLGLESFVKTTGGKGLHVQVPLARRHDWQDCKEFARALARFMARHRPERYTATLAKRARDGRIFVDYLRNQAGATAIGPYSPRARPRAPVATPVDWSELRGLPGGGWFSIDRVRRRLGAGFVDPWAPMVRVEQILSAGAKRKIGLFT
jgi:bifunctional non-homologous end joining protein LigD